MQQLIQHNKKDIEKKGISIFEIFIFVISLVAIAYFLGDEFPLVSATNHDSGGTENTQPAASSAPIPLPTMDETQRSAAAAGGGPEAPPVQEATAPEIPAEGTAATGPTWKSFTDYLTSHFTDLLVNAAIAAGIYYGVKYGIAAICPDCNQNLLDSLALYLSIGYGAGAGIGMLIGALGGNSLPIFGLAGAGFGLIGLGIGAVLFLIFYRDEYVAAVQFTCYPWQPAKGGADCNKCNTGEFPCTKYKCESLGESCSLVNEGTDSELCTFIDRNDISPPTISSWDGPLDKDNYQYVPSSATLPAASGTTSGVTIKYKNSADGCIPPFARLTYGISLDKPGQCRMDIVRKNNFSDMTNPGLLSQGYYLFNHTILSIHASNGTEGFSLPNGGEFEVHIRCESKNGYSNSGTFSFKYCVQKTPDVTPPSIMAENLPNGAPIQFGATSMPTDIYTDKPSDCKWSHSDEDYDTMANSMQCSQSITEMNANMFYKCSTTLTGLKDGEENKFYFRCKSYPLNDEASRYKNEQSFVYTLVGTRSLVLDSLTPAVGDTIKDATQNVKVTLNAKTSAGFNNGAAKCYYKATSAPDTSYVLFLSTDSYQSTQDLFLSKGSYDYSVRCCDAGGNCDSKTTQFDVDTDFESPVIARAFNENNQLKIITNENSTCVYDTHSCSYDFDKGIKMTTLDGISHLADWNTDTSFYIKCMDDFGNQPVPDSCSITVRPFKSF